MLQNNSCKMSALFGRYISHTVAKFRTKIEHSANTVREDGDVNLRCTTCCSQFVNEVSTCIMHNHPRTFITLPRKYIVYTRGKIITKNSDKSSDLSQFGHVILMCTTFCGRIFTKIGHCMLQNNSCKMNALSGRYISHTVAKFRTKI